MKFVDNPNENRKFISYNSMFLNTDSIFIEYNDVIKSPFLLYLFLIREDEQMKTIFDLNEIESLSLEELYEWYITRPYQNILKCLKLQPGIYEQCFANTDINFDSFCDDILYNSLNNNKEIINKSVELNFSDALKKLMSGTYVNKFYIYTPIKSESIEEDLIETFGNKITYVYGNLENVLKENNISNNSTFVFSDISKILALNNVGLLNLASVVIADRYFYNFNDKNEINIDLENLSSNPLFKLNFFDNLTRLE